MDEDRIVSIHQPDFIPWLGFFNKLKRANDFVIMDTAQIPNKKPSYTNRVQLLFDQQAKWGPTIPITKNSIRPWFEEN